MKIAVIGSGISGLASAYFLQQRHDVTLYEQDGRPGGHTNTIRVPLPGGAEQPVDTGWIVYNGPNYPNLTALFGDLGVETRPTVMSFGVSLGDGAYEWKGSDNLLTVFAQPANLFRPSHWRLIFDILRLNRVCNARLDAGTLPEGSLGKFLDDEGFGAELRSRYLLPMAGLIWSCSPRKAAEYPVADFMRFFRSHGLFTTLDQPQWRTVVGGSQVYVQKLLKLFRGELRLATPVQAIRREPGAVHVRTADGERRFDRVVCAVHSDQAMALLADATAPEKRVLGGVPYLESRCVLHTDESFLPKRRAAWAAWNYTHARDEVHDERISGTYWMNLLQGIPGPVNYLVTLNPTRPIPRGKILYETVYAHPFYSAASVDTHALLAQVQDASSVVFAGAWGGYGFHEDGLKSALRAVQKLDASCMPPWAADLAPAGAVPAATAAGDELPEPAV